MEVFRQGEGEPMLLLHGIWESWHSFSPVLRALSAEHDVLAPTFADHPGGSALPPGKALSVETLLQDCGHTAMFDQPDEVAGRILAFTR